MFVGIYKTGQVLLQLVYFFSWSATKKHTNKCMYICMVCTYSVI